MARRRKGRSPRRGIWIALAIIVVALAALRIALPSFLQDYVNRKLDEIPEYDGHVGDVDVALFRGAYTIEDVKLVKTNRQVEVPFVEADRVDLSVQWGALLDGSWVGEIEFERARLNFVSGPSTDKSQKSIDDSWLPTVEGLFPLRINRFEITDSEIHYRDVRRDPPVDVFIDSAYVVATNLTNSQDISESLFAAIAAEGLAMSHAPLTATMDANPNAARATFDLNLSLRDLRLVELNQFVNAYGGIDFESGSFDMDTELAAADGRIEGYVKPIFHDVDIVELDEDADNPLELVWEGLVGVVGKLFTNPSEDQMATTVPIRGRTDNPDTSVLSVIGGLLQNAFIEALKPGVEGTVDLDRTESKKKQEVEKEAKEELEEEKLEDDGG